LFGLAKYFGGGGGGGGGSGILMIYNIVARSADRRIYYIYSRLINNIIIYLNIL
jgi:hypothetical protein